MISDGDTLYTLQERYHTLNRVSGGMGLVHIAVDRGRAQMLRHVDDIVKKVVRMDPNGLRAEGGGGVTLSEKDTLRVFLHLASGLLDSMRRLRNDTLVAIKLIRPDLSRDRALEAFRYEARMWLEVADHPNVVQLREIVRLPDQLALVLQYVDGGTLAEHLAAGGPIDVPRSLEIARDMCRGLRYLHSTLGIIHRDLKPSNVLLSLDGTAQLSDLGLAKAVGGWADGVGTAASGGTPAYMAPEQRNSPGKGDRRSDIYSFGLILFEMVTGKWAPPQAIPDKLLETSLPDQLQHLIKTCVRDDPAQRYADVGELEYTLNALTNKLGVRLPISPDASVSLEVALMDWCGKILPNVASIPPREIAYSVSQNVGPVIDHSVLGADGSEKRRKLREDGPAAHQTELTRQGRVAQWVRRFGEDASSDVVWEQMYEQQERLQDELSGPGPLSSDGVSFWRWYQKAMGLLALGCVEESLKCFDHVISGVADDGLVWDPKGRTEYGLACLGKGLALIELDRRAEAAKVLDLALDARFYPMGVRNSYLTLTPGKIRIDKTDVTDLGKYGREIAAVRQARSLC